MAVTKQMHRKNKAAYRLWYAAFPRVRKASQRLPPAGGKTLQAFCFQKCSTSISSSQARPSSYCFRREGIPQVLKDGGHLRCQRVRVEVRLGQVALEVLDEPADGERRQRVGKFRAVRHGAAVGAHAGRRVRELWRHLRAHAGSLHGGYGHRAHGGGGLDGHLHCAVRGRCARVRGRVPRPRERKDRGVVHGAGAARAGVRGRRARAPAARAAGAVRRRERKNRGAGSCLHPGFAFAPRCVIMGHHGRKELRSQWSKCSLSATAEYEHNPSKPWYYLKKSLDTYGFTHDLHTLRLIWVYIQKRPPCLESTAVLFHMLLFAAFKD